MTIYRLRSASSSLIAKARNNPAMTSTACFPSDDARRANTGKLARLGACMFGIANSFYLTLSAAPSHLATLGGDAAAGSATTVATFATVAASLMAPRLVTLVGRRMVFGI